MIGDMERITDEKLSSHLAEMKVTAPDGFMGQLMQKVRLYKPKKSLLPWLIPVAGVASLALVLVISMGIFNGNSSSGDMVARDSSPTIVSGIVEKGLAPGAPSAKLVFADDKSPVARSRSEVPIGGYIETPSDGFSEVGLSGKLSAGDGKTARLISGLTDSAHLNSIIKSMNKYGDPFVRSDNYGNFIIDIGIFTDVVDQFEDDVCKLFHEFEETDKGSVLVRVTALK